jgi:hypothetical protein
VNLIDAIAKLISATAWPSAAVVVAVTLMRRHRTAIDRLLGRAESAKFPGGVELAFATVVEEQKDRVIDAAERVADAPPEQRDAEIEKLIKERDFLEKFERLRKVAHDKSLPLEERKEALTTLAYATVAYGQSLDLQPASAEGIMWKALLISVKEMLENELDEVQGIIDGFKSSKPSRPLRR